MKDQERMKPEAERVQDLEVKEDEARDIAGGKQKAGYSRGSKKAAGRVQNMTESISLNKR